MLHFSNKQNNLITIKGKLEEQWLRFRVRVGVRVRVRVRVTFHVAFFCVIFFMLCFSVLYIQPRQ